MAALTVQRSNADNPTSVTYTAAASSGDTFANTGRERLWVHNTGSSFILVTLASYKLCNQGFMHPSQSRVDAGASVVLGPFDAFRFNDATGNAHVTYSGVTGVTVAVTG